MIDQWVCLKFKNPKEAERVLYIAFCLRRRLSYLINGMLNDFNQNLCDIPEIRDNGRVPRLLYEISQLYHQEFDEDISKYLLIEEILELDNLNVSYQLEYTSATESESLLVFHI